jgi:hypothetical protein
MISLAWRYVTLMITFETCTDLFFILTILAAVIILLTFWKTISRLRFNATAHLYMFPRTLKGLSQFNKRIHISRSMFLNPKFKIFVAPTQDWKS